MPVLLKKPWAGQPQGEAQLNPLLRRPALVWVGSNPFRSYLYPTVPSLLDATATVGVGPGGRALKLATATPSRMALTTAAPTDLFPTGLADCTIAIVRRHTDTTARGATTFGSDIGATNRILLHAPFSDGNIYWDFGNATAGSGRASGAYGSKTTEVECIVAVAGQTKGREVWRGKIGDNPTRLVQNTSAKATMTNLVSNPAFSLGSSASTVIADNEEQYLFIVSYDEWSDEDIRQWCRDPWGRTFAEQTIFVPQAAASGASGTSATTNANDTSSASGTTTIVGTLARTNANDTSSASGTTTVVGTSATTNANDTSSASGTVGSGSSVTGTSATTNANDTGSASGTTTVVGTSATTNANDTASASGFAGSVSGTSATTNANDTSSASGFVGAEQAPTKTGGRAYLNDGFVKARKRLHLQRILSYLTEEKPSEETKKLIREIKAGKPVPQDKKPPVVMAEVSAEKLAEKLIPARVAAIKDDVDLQAVVRKAIQIAQERDDEEVLLLL